MGDVMSDYKTDQDRFLDNLVDLATFREAAERERRLKALMKQNGRSRQQLMAFREQLVRHCVENRGMTEAKAIETADVVLYWEPSN